MERGFYLGAMTAGRDFGFDGGRDTQTGLPGPIKMAAWLTDLRNETLATGKGPSPAMRLSDMSPASLEQLNHFAWAMFANPGLESVTLRDLVTISACSLPLLIVQLIQHSRDDQEFWTNWPLVAQVAAGLAVYYGIIFLQAPKTYPFIYFQF